MGGGPASLAVAAGAVWVANQDAGTVSRIDDGTVLRVDAATGKQVARVRVASGVGRTGPARRVTPLLGLTPGGA